MLDILFVQDNQSTQTEECVSLSVVSLIDRLESVIKKVLHVNYASRSTGRCDKWFQLEIASRLIYSCFGGTRFGYKYAGGNCFELTKVFEYHARLDENGNLGNANLERYSNYVIELPICLTNYSCGPISLDDVISANPHSSTGGDNIQSTALAANSSLPQTMKQLVP